MVIVGAGIAGIATAYALVNAGVRRLTLLDALAPMSLTSAKSGENFRTRWPQPELAALMTKSIALMDAFCAREDVRVSRRGYLYATRTSYPESMIDHLLASYDLQAIGGLRVHDTDRHSDYRAGDQRCASPPLVGADVLLSPALIARSFPDLDPSATMLIHVRQAGDVDSQHMASRTLARVRAAGSSLRRATVVGIAQRASGEYAVDIECDGAHETLTSELLVNAAGPFAGAVADILGVQLPLICVAQQKLAFEDSARVVPRDAPLTIDVDDQQLAFSEHEREALAVS